MPQCLCVTVSRSNGILYKQRSGERIFNVRSTFGKERRAAESQILNGPLKTEISYIRERTLKQKMIGLYYFVDIKFKINDRLQKFN